MKNNNLTELQKNFNNSVNEYLNEFCQKFDVYLEYWISDEIGGIAAIGDYFINFFDIKYIVDNGISWYEFVNWYDLSLEKSTIRINLKNFIKLRSDFINKHGKYDQKRFIRSYLKANEN